MHLNEHLDSTYRKHHDAIMRTTVTLDKDVEQMLRNAMHQSKKSFKRALNDAVRNGLSKRETPKSKRFVVRPYPIGIRAGIEPMSYNKLIDELEVEAFLEKDARLRNDHSGR
jgi:hypothetical protein